MQTRERLALRHAPAPSVDHQAVKDLLQQARSSSYLQQLDALQRLAQLLESEEAVFRDVTGDPWAIPNQRAGFNVGKIVALIKDQEQVYNRIAEGWVMSGGATLHQQAVGLRFLLAVLTCSQFEYPLTEEAFMDDMHRWAAEYGDATPVPLDDPPKDEAALVLEERSVYATGLLAASLSNLDYVESLVKGPLLGSVIKYLRTAVLEPQPGKAQRAGTVRGGSDGERDDKPAAAVSAGVAVQAGRISAACFSEVEPVPAAAGPCATSEPVLASRARLLRHNRVLYCVQIISQTGEFVESLAPVLQEQGVEVVIALLRHCHSPSALSLAQLGEPRPLLMYEVLEMLCSLLTHRRFAEMFVEQGGVQQLLQLPRDLHSFTGLAVAFFGLATMPLAFERLCSLPITQQLLAAMLPLIGCGFDKARKTAAMFFGASIHYRAILKEFDAQDGLRRLLNMLRALVAQLRQAAQGGGQTREGMRDKECWEPVGRSHP